MSIEQLCIYPILESLSTPISESDLLMIHAKTITGLDKKSWSFSRGAKTERFFLFSENKAIRTFFEYEMTPDNRSIKKITKKEIEWLNTKQVAIYKKDVTPAYNKKDLALINRQARQGRIDYLESSAETLRETAEALPEPYKSQYLLVANGIDMIFDAYSIDINEYISRGSIGFEEAVLNETNTDIISIFNIVVRPPDALYPKGLTVKQSIIHQLTGEIIE